MKTIVGTLAPENIEAYNSKETQQLVYMVFKYGAAELSDESYTGLEHIEPESLQKLEELRFDICFKKDWMTFRGGGLSYSEQQDMVEFMNSLEEALKVPAVKELRLSGSFRVSFHPSKVKFYESMLSPIEYRVNVKPDGTLTYQRMKHIWDEEVTPEELNTETPPTAELKEDWQDEGNRVVMQQMALNLIDEHLYYVSNPEAMEDFLDKFEIIQAKDTNGEHNHIIRWTYWKQDDSGVDQCVKVIRRKSDGRLFGYPYLMNEYNFNTSANGEAHGFSTEKTMYVWLPVEPCLVTGFKFTDPYHEYYWQGEKQ